MKLIYVTNIWSHHQVPVATALVRLLGPENFKMALFEEVHDERRKMGWAEKKDLPWVLGPPRNSSEMKTLQQECIDADVVVLGSCPRQAMETRIETGKLTFVANERMLKKSYHLLRMINPRYAKGIKRYRTMVNHKHVHALTMGHYAPADLHKIGAFHDRIWTWGYFIDVPKMLPEAPPHRPLKLLWCGRMLDWKRVDLLLKAMARLHEGECVGSCLVIGDGPEHKRLLALAQKLQLSPNVIQFLPSASFKEIRRFMRECDVYVLPSNRYEGWGAVAGESMSEGCVLIANEQAGAARELVVDGETGLLFKDGDSDDLASCIEHLHRNYSQRLQMRQLAWERMRNVWSPDVAAERLVQLINGLLAGQPPKFADGPCSHFSML